MPLLDDQIYPNASGAFALDPQLRALLQNTAEAAAATGTPLYGVSAGALPTPGGTGGPPPTPGTRQPEFTPAQVAAIRAQQSTPRADKLPVTIMPVASGWAPKLEPSGAAQAPVPGSMAPPARPATQLPNIAASEPPSKLAAFLRGLGSSDAILPALGGAMTAVENVDRASAAQNQTIRALVNRGLDAETAAAAAANPAILKAVLPTLFRAPGATRLEEIYHPETGQPMKIIRGPGSSYTPVGGVRQDRTTSQLSVAQGKANIKRVQAMQEDAKAADEQLGYLGQLKATRETVGYEGYPGANMIAGIAGLFGSGGGQTIQSLALNIQLGFTARTKGAITDREMGMFAAATPGLAMTDAGANNVIAGMAASFQRVKERAKFYEAYMAAHNGSLEGAQDVWDAYIAQNPILEQRADGTFAVKRNNIGNWRNYVEASPAEAATSLRGQMGAGGTGPISSSYSPARTTAPNTATTPWKPRIVQRGGKTYKESAPGQWQEWVP